MNLVESTAEVIENAREFSNIVKGNSIAYDRFPSSSIGIISQSSAYLLRVSSSGTKIQQSQTTLVKEMAARLKLS